MLVKSSLLIGVENFTHVEDMADRCFLEIAHAGMNLVDGRPHPGSVFVFGFHRLRELGVGSARRGLEPGPFHSEARFEYLKALLLLVC